MTTVTKTDIAATVRTRTGISKAEAKHMVELVLDAIMHELNNGNDVLLRDFGKFRIITKPEQTVTAFGGSKVTLPQRACVSFKVSRSAARRVRYYHEQRNNK